MKEYNGHRSYNAWNVSLWIGNDEGLYNLALDCIKRARRTLENRGKGNINPVHLAARIFIGEIGWGRKPNSVKTPDGATYTFLNVKLALQGLTE